MASYYRRKNGTYCIRVSRGKPGGKQELVSTTYNPFGITLADFIQKHYYIRIDIKLSPTIKAEYVSAADPIEKSSDRKEKNAGKNDSETN